MKTKKRFLSILLSLVLMLGLFPGMSLTAYAENTESLLTTITTDRSNFATYTVAGIAEVSGSNIRVGMEQLSEGDTWCWEHDSNGKGQLTVTGKEGCTITRVVFTVTQYPGSGTRTYECTEEPYAVYPYSLATYPTQADQDAETNSLGSFVMKIEVYGYATPSHTHEFTYSLNDAGDTITATCSGEGDCDLTNKQATLTIAAEGGTYDGTTTYSATVTNNIPGVTLRRRHPINDKSGRGDGFAHRLFRLFL